MAIDMDKRIKECAKQFASIHRMSEEEAEERIRAGLFNDYIIGVDLAKGEHHSIGLSDPPTIEQRIKAAMLDEYPYQVIYYNRIEGASSAILDIAKNDNNVVVLGTPYMAAFYKYVPFRSCQSRIYNLDGVSIEGKVFIADVVSDKHLKEWRNELLYRGARLIAIKSIRSDG